VVRRRVKQVGYWECWALITGAGARAEGPEVEASAAVGEESQGAGQRAEQRHRRSGSLDWLAGLGREVKAAAVVVVVVVVRARVREQSTFSSGRDV
jgi:hypothetical protein